MDFSIFSDPIKVGPGIWFKMHIDAINAVTDALKEAFIININAVCDNFKCKKCQPHFRKFIDTHPLQNYWHIRDSKGRDIGFFQWTWEMHNQVNRFLKKYEPTLEEAYEFYSNSETGACFNCGSDTNVSINNSNIRSNNIITPIPEQRSRAIPQILTLYRESGDLKPQPFKLIPHN
jgi:hypothetical protein